MFEKLSGCRHHGYNARQILVNPSSLPLNIACRSRFHDFLIFFASLDSYLAETAMSMLLSWPSSDIFRSTARCRMKQHEVGFLD